MYVIFFECTTAGYIQRLLTDLNTHFKVPSKIWLVEQQLPRLGSGKIDKRGLKNPLSKIGVKYYDNQAETVIFL